MQSYLKKDLLSKYTPSHQAHPLLQSANATRFSSIYYDASSMNLIAADIECEKTDDPNAPTTLSLLQFVNRNRRHGCPVLLMEGFVTSILCPCPWRRPLKLESIIRLHLLISSCLH